MDPTLREVNIWKSVKKFFVDGLEGSGIIPYFDRIISRPSKEAPDKWVNVLVENPNPAHVSSATMTVFCFSREDHEGDDLAQVRDKVLELLYPKFVDLYDASTDPWTKVGGMMVTVSQQSNTVYNPDNSKMLYIQTTLRWGAVWS